MAYLLAYPIQMPHEEIFQTQIDHGKSPYWNLIHTLKCDIYGYFLPRYSKIIVTNPRIRHLIIVWLLSIVH